MLRNEGESFVERKSETNESNINNTKYYDNMFSWEKTKQRAIQKKIDRHFVKLNACLNPSQEVSDKEFKLKYQGDINLLKTQTGKQTISKRITEEVQKLQQQSYDRSLKYGNKQ